MSRTFCTRLFYEREYDKIEDNCSYQLLVYEYVLDFFGDEKKNHIGFLLTNRLNQDVIEYLFSIIRQKGSYNRNPTARVIRTSFRNTAIYSLICTSKGSNREKIKKKKQTT